MKIYLRSEAIISIDMQFYTLTFRISGQIPWSKKVDAGMLSHPVPSTFDGFELSVGTLR